MNTVPNRSTISVKHRGSMVEKACGSLKGSGGGRLWTLGNTQGHDLLNVLRVQTANSAHVILKKFKPIYATLSKFWSFLVAPQGVVNFYRTKPS